TPRARGVESNSFFPSCRGALHGVGEGPRKSPPRSSPERLHRGKMAVHIRLARHGSKKRPFYRVVVTDQRNSRDGRFIENLGTFDPSAGEGVFQVDRARIDHWKSVGAQVSSVVDRLLKRTAGAAQG